MKEEKKIFVHRLHRFSQIGKEKKEGRDGDDYVSPEL
jgi:hypothetical protein